MVKDIIGRMAGFVRRGAKLELDWQFVQCYIERSDGLRRMKNELRFCQAIIQAFEGN